MDYEAELYKILIDLGIRKERAAILAANLLEQEIFSKEDLMRQSTETLRELDFKLGEVTKVTKSKIQFEFLH